MKKVYAHGEVAFVTIDKLPEGLEENNTDIFAKGNTGNNHTFKGGKFYPKKFMFYFLYFKTFILRYNNSIKIISFWIA